MDAVFKYLKGKKTLGIVFLGLVLIAARALGWVEIDAKLFGELKSALILASIAALRVGIK